ncbi:Nodule Cysteine-Rich (NCR) secreted peptide [Medicago truncatula]|uniref:Nodule Cysteine-Rich (NCR) secreted peptide n=2 Tax=Medicago truncatula TaxID=3880 RepID=A0A072TZB3_MEDTR|nr:Nodule Cysteine-Rich (NCR) secreted peptide [Medicago truncatula]
MAKTLKFVYVVILFISIFLVLTVYDSKYFQIASPCVNDKDCPQFKNNNVRCRRGFCVNSGGATQKCLGCPSLK